MKFKKYIIVYQTDKLPFYIFYFIYLFFYIYESMVKACIVTALLTMVKPCQQLPAGNQAAHAALADIFLG